MSKSFALLVLFAILNIDVVALLIYAQSPDLFERKELQSAEPVLEQQGSPLEMNDPVLEAAPEISDPGEFPTEPESEQPEITELAELILPNEQQTLRPDMMLRDKANFRQDERGWAYEQLGNTDETMREFGCTVTSVANAITNFHGDYITPKVLNQDLIRVGAFTDRGWLIWSKISEATDGRYSATIFNTPSEENIDSCLADNQYPIVKIMLRGVVQHWVLIVGRKNGEYMIRDPLEGDRAEKPIKLSSRAKRIHSLRCIKRN